MEKRGRKSDRISSRSGKQRAEENQSLRMEINIFWEIRCRSDVAKGSFLTLASLFPRSVHLAVVIKSPALSHKHERTHTCISRTVSSFFAYPIAAADADRRTQLRRKNDRSSSFEALVFRPIFGNLTHVFPAKNKLRSEPKYECECGKKQFSRHHR